MRPKLLRERAAKDMAAEQVKGAAEQVKAAAAMKEAAQANQSKSEGRLHGFEERHDTNRIFLLRYLRLEVTRGTRGNTILSNVLMC